MAATNLQKIGPTFYVSEGRNPSGRVIAGFDLDWTLIRTIRGQFPKDEADGYVIVIFTNQGYKGAKLTLALARINHIIEALHAAGLEPWVLVATGKDFYRKPNLGMWDFMKDRMGGGVRFAGRSSFYTGDAAGRPQDYDDNDRQFAHNAGLSFFVPEDIFPQTMIPNPHRHLKTSRVDLPSTQNMLIFVGMPGAGKSTFYRKYLDHRGYRHANQDVLKTKAKVLEMVRGNLANGQSVVVDATNPTLEGRRQFLDLAIEYQVPTMIIYFVGDGHGWNKLRGTPVDPTSKPVPSIAYSMYYKQLVEPTFETDGVPVVQIMS
jgi:bifunctional polynucleotide phosphatase/kinase